jgi:PhoPQ-activated pathogenicity-related protein
VTDFADKKGFGQIKKFMIAGGSKRGWVVWTTAAVDKRVFAAIPIVMDMADFNTVYVYLFFNRKYASEVYNFRPI